MITHTSIVNEAIKNASRVKGTSYRASINFIHNFIHTYILILTELFKICTISIHYIHMADNCLVLNVGKTKTYLFFTIKRILWGNLI